MKSEISQDGPFFLALGLVVLLIGGSLLLLRCWSFEQDRKRETALPNVVGVGIHGS